jgi:hypothetical protein
MIKSEELTGTTEYMTLHTRCRINRLITYSHWSGKFKKKNFFFFLEMQSLAVTFQRRRLGRHVIKMTQIFYYQGYQPRN